MIAPTRREHHIRIRLSPKPAPAMAITASAAERAALEEAAIAAGHPGNLSTFLRDLGWHAAAVSASSRDAESAFREAADAVGLGVGQWLRVISLAAIGVHPLVEQIEAAKKGVAKASVSKR